jgi:hypothetical protein
MTMMEAVKVVPALREAAVLEPLAAVMALYESTTSWSRAIKVAACIGSGTVIGAAGEVAATARHCAGMATTAAPPTAAAPTAEGSMASSAPAPTAAVATTATAAVATTATAAAAAMDERNSAAMDAGAHSVLKVRRTLRLSRPHNHRGQEQAAREGSHCDYSRSHDVFPF